MRLARPSTTTSDSEAAFAAVYYDGQTAAAKTVEVRLYAPGALELRDGFNVRRWSLDAVDIGAQLAGRPAVVELPESQRLEIAAADRFYAALKRLPGQRNQWVHWLEQRWPLVVASLVMTVMLGFAFAQWGVPVVARALANATPEAADDLLGREGLDLLDRFIFSPSQLDADRQLELRALFADIADQIAQEQTVRLEFRSGDAIGPNAFALPSGIVIMTDELVALAENDEEIAAVLAHEIGHVIHRHSLRILIQNSLVAGLVVAVTGDVGSAANLAAGIPTFLVQAAYSRDFEREADDVATDYLRRNQIDPARLGELLLRIEAQYGVNAEDTSLLSTHPSSRERLERARDLR